jgi:hypothetical protein
MNTSTSSYYYHQDYYYYADNYNYTENYLENYGLTQRTALFTGIVYILFAGITLALYLRLLTVIRVFVEY